MPARRASSLAVTSVVAAALLLVVLVAWASSIGPSGVLRGDGPSPADTPTATAPASATADPAEVEPPEPPESRSTPPWVRTLAVLLNIAALVALVLLAGRFVVVPAVRSVRMRRRARRRRAASPVGFAVLDPPEAVAREMLADAAAQRRVLAEGGTPRNAVVACWHRFETQAATAGIERRPWETSSEYTMRVLDLVDAYQPAVSRLGELYREARFSEHELTEAHRREALESLDAIHRTIGVGV